MYVVIHELAHYFAYTRKDEFFNKLLQKIKEVDLLGKRSKSSLFNSGSRIWYRRRTVWCRNATLEETGYIEKRKTTNTENLLSYSKIIVFHLIKPV